MVGSTKGYNNSIPPPGDSGSRSTSGGTGEGSGPVITNEFIHWAFNEYIPQHPEIDLERFAQRIIQSISHMKDKDRKRWFWQSVQRAPAHAILTSHHKETILRLVQCSKEIGLDLLAEKSSTHKTALHVAAEDNDVESIHLLLQL